MRSKFRIAFFSTLFFVMLGSLIISSCTKEGPEGPPGLDGADATETCQTCHDFTETIVAKIGQYENSAHAFGANINRNYEGCSQCHTSQGFRTLIEEGTMSSVHEPTAINCRTCHPIHTTYTTDDYTLRTSDAVALNLSGENYDFSSSNLCVNCHQARPVSPLPSVGGEDVTITNARWGPHYAPQGNIFAGKGKGGYEVAGSMAYNNSTHSTMISDGCVTCHMSTPVGYQAGGHQMNVSYGNGSYNYSACGDCHSDVSSLATTMTNHREEIQGMLDTLKTLIVDQGLMNANGMFSVPITLTANQAGAVLNYKLVYYDHSYGAHNYPYVKALLTNSIEVLGGAPAT